MTQMEIWKLGRAIQQQKFAEKQKVLRLMKKILREEKQK